MPPVCRLGTEPGEHSLYPQPYLTLTLTLTPMCHLRAGCSFISFSARSGDCLCVYMYRAAAMDTHVPAAQGSLPPGEDHGTRVHRVNQPRVAPWHRRRLLLVP